MAKDKPAKRISMKEVIAEKAQKEAPTSSTANEPLGNEFLFSDEQNEKLKKYNENIADFNELYTSIKPRFNVLVRAFVQPMEEGENGVLKPNTVEVALPTKAGVGDVGTMTNPYPFIPKAVVVAVPEEVKDIKPGDVVTLSQRQVVGRPMGRGNNAMVIIPNSFVHPNELHKYPPESPVPYDPSDYNYGYMEIKPYDINFVLNVNLLNK